MGTIVLGNTRNLISMRAEVTRLKAQEANILQKKNMIILQNRF